MVKSKLNILHIDTEKYWRGGQQQVLYLHKGLVERKINSLLICNKSSKLKEKCEENNLPFLEVSIFGEIDVFSAIKIARICKSRNINIIQVHTGHALSIGLMIKMILPKLRLIAVRRVDFSIAKNFLSKLKYNNDKIDIIICISDFIKKVLINDGIDEKKLKTVRSGVNIKKFDSMEIEKNFRKKIGVMPGEFLIGTVAAFAGHKDYPNLLRAFSLVVKENENVKLCIVGDGPLKNEITKLISKYGISEKVIMTGFRNDVGKFLKSFDLFVLASKKEGLGTTLIDALSVCLPIVATKAGGIPELIEHDYNGILVEVGDSTKLADSIIQLIKHDSKRNQLAQNAGESIKQFSIEHTINQNIQEYQNLLGT